MVMIKMVSSAFFKRDKRQRVGSGEERGWTNIIQKLNKIESDLSEVKGLTSDIEEIITDTPLIRLWR